MHMKTLYYILIESFIDDLYTFEKSIRRFS